MLARGFLQAELLIYIMNTSLDQRNKSVYQSSVQTRRSISEDDFGSQAEIQVSVSSAITIIRLWRRVLELQKMLLHSKPGAKTDPSKPGKFVTNGCYISAKILFAAATLYQLAVFLHFRDVGLFGGSLSSILALGPQSVLSANCRGRRMKFNLLIPSQRLQICLIKFPRCSSM